MLSFLNLSFSDSKSKNPIIVGSLVYFKIYKDSYDITSNVRKLFLLIHYENESFSPYALKFNRAILPSCLFIIIWLGEETLIPNDF